LNEAAATITIPTFTCDVTLIRGSNIVEVVATDNAGNTNTVDLTINFIPGPEINITSPQNLTLFNSSPITVSGTIDDSSATVTVNGIAASVGGGTFTASNVSLEEGSNTITAEGIDSAGNLRASIIKDNILYFNKRPLLLLSIVLY
jgi:hypothetical protein